VSGGLSGLLGLSLLVSAIISALQQRGGVNLAIDDSLDEDEHFLLLDGAGVVLVQFAEEDFEVLLAELVLFGLVTVHLGEGVHDEGSGFTSVELARCIRIVLVPDVFNNLHNRTIHY
jgi:hypothetical protein